MLFRRRMHRHWHERSHGEDSGAKGLKSAMVEWSHLWLVSTTLAMTVAFAMLIGDHHKLPTGDDAIAERIAAYLFIGFTLRAMYHSLFLIVACALWVRTPPPCPQRTTPLLLEAVRSTRSLGLRTLATMCTCYTAT